MVDNAIMIVAGEWLCVFFLPVLHKKTSYTYMHACTHAMSRLKQHPPTHIKPTTFSSHNRRLHRALHRPDPEHRDHDGCCFGQRLGRRGGPQPGRAHRGACDALLVLQSLQARRGQNHRQTSLSRYSYIPSDWPLHAHTLHSLACTGGLLPPGHPGAGALRAAAGHGRHEGGGGEWGEGSMLPMCTET